MANQCPEIPPGFAYFTITVPPPQAGYNDCLLRLCVGSLLQLNFTTGEQPQGLPVAATALETAIALEDALNHRDTPTLTAARADYGLHAVRYANLVTVILQAPPEHCAEPVAMIAFSIAAAAATTCGQPFLWHRDPFLNGCTPLTCCAEAEPDCADYPVHSAIQRVRFTAAGQTFGPGATRIRYQVAPTAFSRLIPFPLWHADPRSFDYPAYATFDDWVRGFVAYYDGLGNGWFHAVNYLDAGLVEFVINAENPDILTAGVLTHGLIIRTAGVGVNLLDEVYAPLPLEFLSQTDCADDSVIVIGPPFIGPPSPTELDYTPPTAPPTPDYVPPPCRAFYDFEGCGYSIGGVRRVLATDAESVTAYARDEDGRVTAVTAPVWHELSLKDGVTLLDVAEDRSDAGVRFQVSLAAATHVMTQQNRNVLETLRRRRLVLIVEDANARYWLVGEDGPARLENIAGATGAHHADGNTYAFVFRTFSRTLPREVSAEFIATMAVGAIDCSALVGQPLAQVPLAMLATCELNALAGNGLG